MEVIVTWFSQRYDIGALAITVFFIGLGIYMAMNIRQVASFFIETLGLFIIYVICEILCRSPQYVFSTSMIIIGGCVCSMAAGLLFGYLAKLIVSIEKASRKERE